MTADKENEQQIRFAIMHAPDHEEHAGHESLASRNKSDALGAVAAAASALFIAVVAYVYICDRSNDREHFGEIRDRFESQEVAINILRADNTILQVEIAALKQAKLEHEKNAAYWYGQISEYQKQQTANSQAIALFKQDANSRYDPFTGTEGRALSSRLDVVERCCDQVKDKLRDK